MREEVEFKSNMENELEKIYLDSYNEFKSDNKDTKKKIKKEKNKKTKNKKEKASSKFIPQNNIITDLLYCMFIGINELFASFITMFSFAKLTISEVTKKRTSNTSNNKQNILNMNLNSVIKKIKISLGIYQKELEKLEETRRKLQEELASSTNTKSKVAKVFLYKVKDKDGNFLNGKFTGFSKLDVNSFLLNEGYEVYDIKNNKMIDFVYGESAILPRRWKTKDLVFWLTQLSTYIKSGIPLTNSIKILQEQMGKNKNKKIVMQSIAYELTLGNTFSKALQNQVGVFPPLLINMIQAAEATGDLEATLDDMANYYTEVDSTRRQMISAMTYPLMISVFAIGVITFIILYVVPQFTEIYDSNGMQIKGLTLLIVNLSDFLSKNIFTIILVIILAIATLIFLYKKVKPFRRNAQILLMHLPLIKDIIIYNEIAIFTKTFSSLLKNNVYITESMDILSKITNNEIYKEIMFETIDNITRGDKISASFKDNWAVPPVAYYMMVTGEETGELAQMLDKVSRYYQEQHKTIIDNLKVFIEPVLIAFLAVMVGGIILAVIIPMFDMYGSILG